MVELSQEVFVKYSDLLNIINGYGKPLLALSGGLDSSFLAFAIKDAGVDGTVVTVKSSLFPESERIHAIHISEQLGLDYSIIDLTDRHLEWVKDNPENRCYLCKKAIFSHIRVHAGDMGADIVLDGTTYDDSFSYRPGMRALEELGIISPIKESGITKAEIRMLCRYFNLEFADLPSFSCFATRFPYREILTEGKIERVSRAESFLKALGFVGIRVRSHDNLARIEINLSEIHKFYDSEIMNAIAGKLKILGFDYVTLDLEGFRSGSMDIGLNEK